MGDLGLHATLEPKWLMGGVESLGDWRWMAVFSEQCVGARRSHLSLVKMQFFPLLTWGVGTETDWWAACRQEAEDPGRLRTGQKVKLEAVVGTVDGVAPSSRDHQVKEQGSKKQWSKNRRVGDGFQSRVLEADVKIDTAGNLTRWGLACKSQDG